MQPTTTLDGKSLCVEGERGGGEGRGRGEGEERVGGVLNPAVGMPRNQLC